jgi:hypothetical protein
MTSEEIKAFVDVRSKLGPIGSVDEVRNTCLLEIAYQLAKMNERMDSEDEKFFGGRPSVRERKGVRP